MEIRANVNSCVKPIGRIAGMKIMLLRGWRILIDVLKGYTSGQPIDESRPRKGCC